MCKGRILSGTVLILVIVTTIPSFEGRWLRPAQSTLVQFGTFASADVTCFFKKIFKGQKSPVTFIKQSGTKVNYVLVQMANTNPLNGGVSARIIGGAITTPTIAVEISDGSSKKVFTDDVDVTMLCTAPAGR